MRPIQGFLTNVQTLHSQARNRTFSFRPGISVDLADGLAEGSASAVRFEEHIERKDTLKSLNLVGD